MKHTDRWDRAEKYLTKPCLALFRTHMHKSQAFFLRTGKLEVLMALKIEITRFRITENDRIHSYPAEIKASDKSLCLSYVMHTTTVPDVLRIIFTVSGWITDMEGNGPKKNFPNPSTPSLLSSCIHINPSSPGPGNLCDKRDNFLRLGAKPIRETHRHGIVKSDTKCNPAFIFFGEEALWVCPTTQYLYEQQHTCIMYFKQD